MKKFTAALSMLAMLAALILAIGVSPVAAQDDKPDIAIVSVDLENQTVTIHNNGDADFDPNGIWLCNFPAYAPIAGADMIPAGESIVVSAADTGVNFEAAGGEIALYINDTFDSADSLISYVEWGDAGHQRAPVAAEAGVWDEVAVDAGTETVISATTTSPTGSADWIAGAAAEEAAAEEEPAEEAEAESAETTEAEADALPETGTETWPLIAFAAVLVGAGLLMINGGRRLVRS